MLFSYKKHISVCPKTGQPIKQKSKYLLLKLLCPITGLLALAWFLIRVIPKPSRATYPCQRVAFPLASSFIIWLLGLAGSAAAYHRAKRSLAQARYVMAAVCIFASVAFIWMAMSSDRQEPASAHEPIVNNAPMGEGKGINPGRVAWIHDPNATNWSGASYTVPPLWYENVCTDQQVVNAMLSKALRAMTGEVTDSAAWDAIFRNFNEQKGRGNVGYTPGEKIAIKINFVLMVNKTTGVKDAWKMDNIDNSPQLAIALLKQLTDIAGVDPCNISIGDPQNCMPDYWYNVVGPNCPNVVYLTRSPLTGRTTVAPDNDANFYWSDPCAAHWSGVTNTDKIPTHFSQATYFINFSILKSHNSSGITLSGKNNYGSLMRAPNATGYYNMHHTRPYNNDGSPFSEPGMGFYRANVDLMAHPKLGGKTILALIDGLYAGRSYDAQTIKWDMPPFNGDWPSSIFLSQDQVAADSVAFDFMDNEWDTLPANDINGYPQFSGTEDYLHEAALIGDPCSGATYDPNHDGGITGSLGVHEHWNNATDKQYSRNLGTGNGIELVKYAPGWPDLNGDRFVNFEDFAIMANAWRSTTGSASYDANCDISSTPGDGVIDEKDLAVLVDNWLEDFSTELVRPGALPQEVYSANTDFEGPTWDPASDKLFFTKRTSTYQILRLDGPNTVYTWLTPSPQTNGTIMSLDSRLLACDESPMQISSRSIGPGGPGDTVILADSSDGFTRPPNDLCQLANGNIYFTTPKWDSSTPAQQGVWLLEPNGAVRQVDGTLYQPNGIITSLDETKLYVSAGSTTTSRQKWHVFDIDPNGNLSNAAVFFNPTSAPDRTNVPDGMTIDEMGNLYFTGLGGVWIVSPAGIQLKFISLPKAPLNIAFGGPDGRTLYITCKNKVYSLSMSVRGGEATSW